LVTVAGGAENAQSQAREEGRGWEGAEERERGRWRGGGGAEIERFQRERGGGVKGEGGGGRTFEQAQRVKRLRDNMQETNSIESPLGVLDRTLYVVRGSMKRDLSVLFPCTELSVGDGLDL